MAKFRVTNTTILHNQKTYGVGDSIELTDEIQIEKLAAYITPVEDVADSTAEQSTDSQATAGTDSPATTGAKISKANKKSDKSTPPADANTATTTPATDTAPSTDDAVASDASKQEGANAATSV